VYFDTTHFNLSSCCCIFALLLSWSRWRYVAEWLHYV